MRIAGTERLRRTARRVMNRFHPRAIILLYHRVIDLPLDPQLICVSRRNFAEHLQVIREYGRAIHMKTLDQALRGGNRRECAVIVTFDDGYADNLYNAKPLLERYDIPATVFVTSGYLGAKKEFWYDGLERILLHSVTLPEKLRLQINEHWYEWELISTVGPGENTSRNFCKWNISRKDDPSVRHTLYRSLYQILHPLPDGERDKIIEALALWADIEPMHRPTHRTLLPEELIRLADGGLVEVGSHTVSHPLLSAIPLVEQTNEISRSKSHLEYILGHPVSTFAYPFGGRTHYTEQTVAAVREAGFAWACSSFAGLVGRDTDPWQLPRFVVRDWDRDEFARALEGWIDG